MVRLDIDLRFARIATEGVVASRHAQIAVRRLTATADEVRELVLSELERGGTTYDEVERDIAFQEISFLEDELPRLEIYSVVFMLFAVFESVVKRLPEEPSLPQFPSQDSPRAIRREFVSNVGRYYRDKLHVELFSDAREQEFMMMLGDIRMSIAHATGEVSALDGLAERRVREQWLRKYDGLSVVNGHLEIAPELVIQAADVVEECLSGVIERLKQAYPRRMPKHEADAT
jgi:hypothetical protein